MQNAFSSSSQFVPEMIEGFLVKTIEVLKDDISTEKKEISTFFLELSVDSFLMASTQMGRLIQTKFLLLSI
jgi:hypothetical protein